MMNMLTYAMEQLWNGFYVNSNVEALNYVGMGYSSNGEH